METVEESLKRLFEARFKKTPESCQALSADGSNRKYFRLQGPGGSVIGSYGPDARENAAFLSFAKHFRSQGIPVPEIYAEDAPKGVYLQEDLGDLTFFKFLSERRAENGFSPEVERTYESVIRLLPRIQIEAGRGIDYGYAYPRASFDRQSMIWDMNHFKYYFLQLANIPFHEQALEDDFAKFADFLLQAPRDFFLYRDFQSRNIMLKDGKPYFIDFQGGRKGALQYDIASLLFDAKADLPFPLRHRLLDLYIKEASQYTAIDRPRFLELYFGCVFIRIMQAMGAYGLRGFYERKAHFLQSIPYAVRNIEHLLRTVELPIEMPEMTKVFQRIVASSYLRQFGKIRLKLTVRIQSFSFKTGIPMDETGHGGGFVFDCRSLPNPGRQQKYAPLTGKDAEVAAYLAKDPSVKQYLAHVFDLVDGSVENYRSRNFTDLMIAFGCTGGRHRSVYCAERLGEYLKEKHGVEVEIIHRMLEKNSAEAV